MFAKQLCADADLNINGYPDFCACIGGQGRVNEIRALLKNAAYRPICHDGKCLDITDKKVFRYEPTMPCSEQSICSKNICFLAPELNLKNNYLRCNFKSPDGDGDELPDAPGTLSSSGMALRPDAKSRRYVWFVVACLCVAVFIAALLLK
jgi:hypothetical protein